MKTVAILIPLSWDVVPRQFFFSMLEMMAYSIGKYHIVVTTARAANISKMHEAMVKQIKGMNVDYILHMDADEEYPEDTPERLMKHVDDGKDVVMGLVARHRDGGYVVYDFTESPLRIKQRDIQPNTGLVKVDCIGMGGLMVNPRVYDTLDEPYFSGILDFPGPDTTFSYKCKQKGIDIWVDTDLRFGHVYTGVRYDG